MTLSENATAYAIEGAKAALVKSVERLQDETLAYDAATFMDAANILLQTLYDVDVIRSRERAQDV